MAKPTDRLREMRERAGLSLEEVQDRTKIQVRYLRAAEEGDFDRFPGKFYTRAFLRAYGEFLGLDPAPLLRQLEEVTASSEEPEPSPAATLSRKERYAAGRRSSSVRVRRLLPGSNPPSRKRYAWLLLVLFVLLIPAVIYYFSAAEKQTGDPEKPAAAEAQGGQAGKEKPSAEIELVKPSETYEYGDLFLVTKAKEVEVTLEAKKDTWFRYRAGGPTKDVTEEADLPAGEKKTFRHPEWVSLLLKNPNHVKLTVNGHVIETSETTESHAYQLKLKK
ncbi:cytoskeletal protein RodZ [Melghirimyces profundicolus]|uniref:Cytoskeletal protein RodZ n=1 Tax=Melghirimyces profundicolus TaxID=1242148 RepID=A0A2T6BRI0_9BACL|nr:RodZ domain-containing protein [Melghirimyces profundicolus]PTX58656.1 cytoskeletal protein RodZ [Melghirimyces profundicolus]